MVFNLTIQDKVAVFSVKYLFLNINYCKRVYYI
jgi:hypothetical protein